MHQKKMFDCYAIGKEKNANKQRSIAYEMKNNRKIYRRKQRQYTVEGKRRDDAPRAALPFLRVWLLRISFSAGR